MLSTKEARVLQSHGQDGAVLQLMLNRPQRGNALDSACMMQLVTALRTAEQDQRIVGIELRGAGPDFCLGGDVSTPQGHVDPNYSAAVHTLADAWLRRQLPVLAVVQGRATAFGAALALTADMVVASPDATVALPELAHGIVPAYAIAVLSAGGRESLISELVWGGQRLTVNECSWHRPAGGDVNLQDSNILNSWAAAGPAATRGIRRLLNQHHAAETGLWLGRAKNALAKTLREARVGDVLAQPYLADRMDVT